MIGCGHKLLPRLISPGIFVCAVIALFGFSDAALASGIFSENYLSSKIVVVGINEYFYGPDLRRAVSDARAVCSLFEERGFRSVELYNQEATGSNVRDAIQKTLYGSQPDDRIIVFFAGHGIDFRGTDGEVKGYLIPCDGRDENLDSLIPIDWLQIELSGSKKVKAKHVLFVLDCCSSGIAAMRTNSGNAGGYALELIRRPARQVITAGTGEQEVIDGGGETGHSVFTDSFIKAIAEDRADMNRDHVITASELGVYLSTEVYRASSRHQKPDFAKLVGTKGGEVLLRTPSPAEVLQLRAERPGLFQTPPSAPVTIFTPPPQARQRPLIQPEKKNRKRYPLVIPPVP